VRPVICTPEAALSIRASSSWALNRRPRACNVNHPAGFVQCHAASPDMLSPGRFLFQLRVRTQAARLETHIGLATSHDGFSEPGPQQFERTIGQSHIFVMINGMENGSDGAYFITMEKLNGSG